MSKNKRSKILSKDIQNTYTVLGFIKTLRRFDLSKCPTSIYYDPNEVFLFWTFAKKYGVELNDAKTKK